LNKFQRGLFALALFFTSFTSLEADYFYKDEVLFNPQMTQDIEKIGKELHDKTGIALRLVVIKKFDDNSTIVDYERNLIKNFSEPTVLLTFSELNQKVDILSRPESLYKYFDKKQILSPSASAAQALFMALFFSKNLDDFKKNVTDFGGSIIPLLAEKSKDNETNSKYSAALFNGYADIADQIAKAKGIKLENSAGDTNRTAIMIIKVIFYLAVLYGLYLYIKQKVYLKKSKNEKK
jgi:hypothetical protein